MELPEQVDDRVFRQYEIISEQAETIAALHSQLAERDKEIAERDFVLLEREKIILEQQARISELEKTCLVQQVQLDYTRGCFEAASCEGLLEKLAELDTSDIGSLQDLVVRRLLPAYYCIETDNLSALKAERIKTLEAISTWYKKVGYLLDEEDIPDAIQREGDFLDKWL